MLLRTMGHHFYDNLVQKLLSQVLAAYNSSVLIHGLAIYALLLLSGLLSSLDFFFKFCLIC